MVKNIEAPATEIPEEIDQLPFFKSYDSAEQKLVLLNPSKIPEEVYDFAENIRILQIEAGRITELSVDFARLQSLEGIFMFGNQGMERFPGVLSDIPALHTFGFKDCALRVIDKGDLPAQTRWPIFTKNPELRGLGDALIDLEKIEKAALVNAGLRDIDLRRSRDLTLLRVSSNEMNRRPSWISEHPGLAYYGDAGNPFNNLFYKMQKSVQRVGWEEVEIEEKINESPASTVYRGSLNGTPVAVKVFKDAVISDGAPESDLKASLQAGTEAHLSSTMGFGIDAPGEKKFIISRFINNDEYQSVALVPNFESCARDTYPELQTFSGEYISNVAQSVAIAMAHLHSRDLLHGDLYGHNILANQQGSAVVTDFGAATPLQTGPLGDALKKLDVRAFGLLLTELMDRSERGDYNSKFPELARQCVSPDISDRPCFAEIEDLIS